MATKRITATTPATQKEVVFSAKYQCNITKETAIFDEVQESWISPAIEKVLKTKELK